MVFQSLETRVVAVFIGVLLSLQLIGYFTIDRAILANARNAVEENLKNDEKIFTHLLELNAKNLLQGASLLAKEYGFLEAIHSKDVDTIRSTLENHGKRIGADLTVLVDLNQNISVTSVEGLSTAAQVAIRKVLVGLSKDTQAAQTAIIEAKPYQIVAVPVRAPVTIGWVVMAIPIGRASIQGMRDLSQMHISLLTRQNGQDWRSNLSTFEPELAQLLAAGLSEHEHSGQSVSTLQVGDQVYGSRIMVLAQNEREQTVAVLQLSLSQAIAPYKKLQRNLLMLTLLGAILASVISIFSARRITDPLRKLTEAALRFGRGDYQAQIEIRGTDEIGKLAQTLLSMRDNIAQREAEVRRLAYWDTLTGLPNRVLFLEQLEQALQQAQTSQQSCFVLMLDLDRFKHVNDVMGHKFGDVLLTQVAQRLSQELSSNSAGLARLGGDEFVIVLAQTELEMALQVASRLMQALELPISIDEQTVDLGAGIGVAGFPAHAQDAIGLLSKAEVAMYVAKQLGNGIQLYSAEIDRSSQQSLSLLSELRQALELHQFRLYVQPKLDLAQHKVVAVEALIRWQHPERGYIYPDQFIPFAEQTGFIRQMTYWVMTEAARYRQVWQSLNLDLKVSVNLSTRDLLDQDLPRKFTQLFEQFTLTPAAFCLEITESAIMDDPQRALQTLDGLHELGLDLSIDDFGTGYSSLAYLKRLPVDELKIDKSFVLKMEHDQDDVKIVKSTIDLGHNLGLRVVAEGVENQASLNLLQQLGCDQAQGYFIARPMPAADFPTWLANWQASVPDAD